MAMGFGHSQTPDEDWEEFKDWARSVGVRVVRRFANLMRWWRR